MMFNEHICPVCNKDFIIPNVRTWAYKRQNYSKMYFTCSWKCHQVISKQIEAKTKRRGRKPKNALCEV